MNPNFSPQDRISISLSTQAQAKSKLLSDLDWAVKNILRGGVESRNAGKSARTEPMHPLAEAGDYREVPRALTEPCHSHPVMEPDSRSSDRPSQFTLTSVTEIRNTEKGLRTCVELGALREKPQYPLRSSIATHRLSSASQFISDEIPTGKVCLDQGSTAMSDKASPAYFNARSVGSNPTSSSVLHGTGLEARCSHKRSMLPNKMNKAVRSHAIQFIQGLDRLAQAIEAHCSIATVQITIWRNEEPVDVSVDILSYYKGYTDRRAGFYTDDPPEVITEDYGVTEEGEEIPLIPSEMENAEEIFLSNQ